TDRAVLAEGRPADVVVFDPKTVGPGPLKRVYDLPAGADRLGAAGGGHAAPGGAGAGPADVVVFDPKTVGPGPLKRVYDLPAGADRLVSEAHGIAAVIVNGQI